MLIELFSTKPSKLVEITTYVQAFPIPLPSSAIIYETTSQRCPWLHCSASFFFNGSELNQSHSAKLLGHNILSFQAMQFKNLVVTNWTCWRQGGTVEQAVKNSGYPGTVGMHLCAAVTRWVFWVDVRSRAIHIVYIGGRIGLTFG